MTQNNKCCAKCSTASLGHSLPQCFNPACECHAGKDWSPTFKEEMAKSRTEKPYSQRDHTHCWESANPPCGNKLHLRCCLCRLDNPNVSNFAPTKSTENAGDVSDPKMQIVENNAQREVSRSTEKNGYIGEFLGYTREELPTTDTSDWRERFDELFGNLGNYRSDELNLLNFDAKKLLAIKAFLEAEVERAREETAATTRSHYYERAERIGFEAGQAAERERIIGLAEGMKKEMSWTCHRDNCGGNLVEAWGMGKIEFPYQCKKCSSYYAMNGSTEDASYNAALDTLISKIKA